MKWNEIMSEMWNRKFQHTLFHSQVQRWHPASLVPSDGVQQCIIMLYGHLYSPGELNKTGNSLCLRPSQRAALAFHLVWRENDGGDDETRGADLLPQNDRRQESNTCISVHVSYCSFFLVWNQFPVKHHGRVMEREARANGERKATHIAIR